MPVRKQKEHYRPLFENILKLQSVEECEQFFEDLCAASELSAMEQRFEVAMLLSEGRVYTDILERTGTSSATISRVNRMLTYGGTGTISGVIARPMPEEKK